ncbi:hypothetical protein ABTL04_19860, partial [Acinetobacter baumannii]
QLVAREADHRFESLHDLKKIPKAIVGTMSGTASSNILKDLGIETKDYDDQVLPYVDLKQKVIDAVLLDLPIALYVVKRGERAEEFRDHL